MIVEFVGIPGAGKSTAAQRTADLIESRGVPPPEIVNLWSHPMTAAQRFRATWCNARLALMLAARVRKRHDVSAVNRQIGREWLMCRLDSPALMESGPVHVASLTAGALDLSPKVLCARVTPPDVVVDLRLSPTVAMERNAVQRKSRRIMMSGDESEVRTKLLEAQREVDAVMDCMDVNRVIFDVEAMSADDVAEAVARLISE